MCTTIVVGKNRSATGSVLVAHSEELGRNSAHKVEISPRRPAAAGETYPLYSGGTLQQPAELPRYIATKIFDKNHYPGEHTGGSQRIRRHSREQHGADAGNPGSKGVRRCSWRHHLDGICAAGPGARTLSSRRRRPDWRALQHTRIELRFRHDAGGRRLRRCVVGGAGARRPMGCQKNRPG